MPPRKKSRKASEKPRRELSIDIAKMTDYEIERMNNCLENNAYLRQLGLRVENDPFASFGQDEYNLEPDKNDNLEPEKDYQELDTTMSDLFVDKTAKKAQPHNQACVLTRSQKASATEISNQTTKEADAAQQNARQTEEEGIVQTPLNQDGPTDMDLADDLFDVGERIRGPNIGKKLDKMTRSRKGKLPLVIEPGKKRPSSVMIAAKFATECNIAVRQSVPIFPHWKEYTEISSRPIVLEYIKRVCDKFDTEKTSIHVQKACVSMLKKAVRQRRHQLKKKYFDAFPLHQVPKESPFSFMSDVQWDALLEYWKNEKKMLTCEKNKDNRSKVQFHQTTGSRSYEMQLINLANKYQDEPPNALDMFKDLHYSKKKGFTPAVQSVIVEMEGKINAPDGEEPKDVAEVVCEVLVQKNKKNSFLVNVGLKSSSASEDNAECELKAELAWEKQNSSDLKDIVKKQQVQMDDMMKNQQVQMEDMMKKFQDAETARAMQEEYKKKQAETDALIRGLMSMIPANRPW